MSKLIAAAKSRSEADPFLFLATTAAGATFTASAVVFGAFVFLTI